MGLIAQVVVAAASAGATGLFWNARKRLQEVHAEHEEFLAQLSHELRVPLANQRIAAQLLRDYSAGLPPERQKQLLDILVAEGGRAISLIEQIESAPHRLEVLTLEWLAELIAPFQELVAQEDKILVVEIKPPVELGPKSEPLRVNLNLLGRVLGELLSNACKYTPTGKTIHFRAIFDMQGVTLCVINPAPLNVNPKELERIFQPAYRSPATALPEAVLGAKGSGLGLAIAKRHMRRLNGRLEAFHRVVSSTEAEIVFCVSVPSA